MSVCDNSKGPGVSLGKIRLERFGKSWPSWQTVSLDRYLAGSRDAVAPVYVKIHGTDCQVREVVLEAGAGERVSASTSTTFPLITLS